MGVKQDMEELAELFKAVFKPARKPKKPASHSSCKLRTKVYRAHAANTSMASMGRFNYDGAYQLCFDDAAKLIEDFGSHGGSGYE